MNARNSVIGMSIRPLTNAIRPPSDDELRSLLQRVRLKVTASRIAVLRYLSVSSSPQSHVEILNQLPETATDRSTVFRVLQDLVDCALAKRMDLGDHVWRFELVRDGSLAETEHAHPHLLCGQCGSVTCLHADELELRVAESLGLIEEILVRGTCCKCLDGSLPTS